MISLITKYPRLIGFTLLLAVVLSFVFPAAAIKQLVNIGLIATLLMHCFNYLNEDIIASFTWVKQQFSKLGGKSGEQQPPTEAVESTDGATASAKAEPNDS